MSKQLSNKVLNRRDFLKLGGGFLGAAAGTTFMAKRILEPVKVVEAARPVGGMQASIPQSANLADTAVPNLHLAATDGWISLPYEPLKGGIPVPPYHPDNLAPAGLTTYIFGFRNVSGLSEDLVHAQKMKAQLAGPIWWLEQEEDFILKVSNLGLQIRPDLIDAHTVHFHGFRNAIPIFDGEPHSSVGVPIIRDLTYFYRPHNPGTYLYHCHFEETEHVHMGMVGTVFINPLQNKTGAGAGVPVARLGGDPASPVMGYVYNDGDGSTAYDRHFAMTLNEVWLEAHWCDSHIQLPDWSDYHAEFYLLNGRVYPDTLAPNGLGTDPLTGDLIPHPDRPDLIYQPTTSLVQVNAGDRVLLRFTNIGFLEQPMSLTGIKMRVVGKDATLLRGRDGTDQSYITNTVLVPTGESVDAIFVAPDVSQPTEFLLYNRNYTHMTNAGGLGPGGQMTKIIVHPAGTLPLQTLPNT